MKTFQSVIIKILLLTFLGMMFLITANRSAFAQSGFLNPDIDLAVSNLVLQPDGKILVVGSFNNVAAAECLLTMKTI